MRHILFVIFLPEIKIWVQNERNKLGEELLLQMLIPVYAGPDGLFETEKVCYTTDDVVH